VNADFWLQKWQRGDIGFHEKAVHPFLDAHVDELRLAPGSRILLPLCGKTLDIHWLLKRGYRVVGVELSPLAVKALFKDLGCVPEITASGALLRHTASSIDIFSGDIFNLTAEQLGRVDALYDRAALVALPAELRQRYAAQVMRLSHAAPQLLITYEYDQSLRPGPPFSVSAQEVERLYAGIYDLRCIESREVSAAANGRPAATEAVWCLRARQIP
jgi:thiopurine S-methyltransferase